MYTLQYYFIVSELLVYHHKSKKKEPLYNLYFTTYTHKHKSIHTFLKLYTFQDDESM